MPTYFTPILTGAAANAQTINNPLTQLDNALIEQVAINVKAPRFGATGDGTTDDSDALDAAIAEANALTTSSLAYGGTVYFPPGVYKVSRTLTAPTRNVCLLGAGGGVWNATYVAPSVIKAVHTGSSVLSLGSSGNSDITIRNLGFRGASGTDLASQCIYAASASLLRLIDVSIDGFGGAAIKVDAGSGHWLEYVQTTNCMLGYGSLAARAGVVQLGGSENYFNECNINGPGTSFGASTSGLYGSGYLAAIYVTGSPVRAVNTVGAFAQNAWILTGTSAPSSFFGCRGEFVQGYGFIIEGSRHKLVACTAFQVGLDTDSTYYGFYFHTSSGVLNELIAPELDAQSGVNKARGLLLDDVASGDSLQRANRVVSPNIGFNTYADSLGWVTKSGNTPLIIAGGVPYHQTLTDGATVNINAALGDYWDLSAGGSRTIAAPTSAYKSQRVLFSIKNNTAGAITTTFNSAFKLAGWTDPGAGKTRILDLECYDGTNWRQVADVTGDLTI